MNADEKSYKAIVPKKQSNKECLSSAEVVEGRTLPKRNTGQATAVRTQSRGAASNGLAGVRQAARQKKDVQFITSHPCYRFDVRTRGRSPVR
jgi:uncharacterized protein YfaP (DUF2135 family)